MVGVWNPGSGESNARERLAGELSGRSIERGVELAVGGEIDGLVTGPISKSALRAAGYRFPGHTELLRDRAGAEEVTMMMVAENTPLGGPLRLALLTAHIPLRDVPRTLTVDLAERRTRIAIRALQDWWGLSRPRIAFAGLNPHASEGGLFGDEEARVLEPAADRLAADSGAEILGIWPADTIFRGAIQGQLDLVVTPYHDVGLAVLKTVARDEGVNVTAGLPFPRTSPDHGTAFDIAGTGTAHPGAMIAAIELCARFCNTGVTIR
jgi:4-hydroxythreonine-4-phosphate dehydrogenase